MLCHRGCTAWFTPPLTLCCVRDLPWLQVLLLLPSATGLPWFSMSFRVMQNSGWRDLVPGALLSQLTPTDGVGLGMGHVATHLLHGPGMGRELQCSPMWKIRMHRLYAGRYCLLQLLWIYTSCIFNCLWRKEMIGAKKKKKTTNTVPYVVWTQICFYSLPRLLSLLSSQTSLQVLPTAVAG